MNATELERIEQRARSVLDDHVTDPKYSHMCNICESRYPCDRRLDAEDTLMLVEWFKTMQEKVDGQKS